MKRKRHELIPCWMTADDDVSDDEEDEEEEEENDEEDGDEEEKDAASELKHSIVAILHTHYHHIRTKNNYPDISRALSNIYTKNNTLYIVVSLSLLHPYI